MDREALRAWIAVELDTLLAEAGIATTDTAPNGLAPVLDAVEGWVTLSPDLSPLWERPLARFYALDRIVARFAANMDVSTGGDSYRLSQQFANAKALRDEARAAVAWIVTPLPASADGGIGQVVSIGIPYLTPADDWTVG